MFTPKRPRLLHSPTNPNANPPPPPPLVGSRSSNSSSSHAAAAMLSTPAAPHIQILPSVLATSSSSSTSSTVSSSVSSSSASASSLMTPSASVSTTLSESRVLLRSEHLVVRAFPSSWPPAAHAAYHQQLQQTPQVQSSCVMDATSGHVALVVDSACFVWSFARPSQACRRYPLPHCRSSFYEPSKYRHLLCFVSRARGEVGLLSCFSDGQLRYWDDVQFGSAAADTYRELAIHIPEGDAVEAMANCEPAGLIVCTKRGSLFRIAIAAVTSSLAMNPAVMTYSTLSRPLGMLARVGSLLGFGGIADPLTFEPICLLPGVKSPDQTHSREMFLLTERSIQKWTLSNTYPEKFVFEEDLAMVINLALYNVTGETVDGFYPLDLQLVKDDMLALLVAQPVGMRTSDNNGADAAEEEPSSLQLLYHIILMGTKKTDRSTSNLPVRRVITLDHRESFSSDGSGLNELLEFKMIIPNGGPAVFVYCPQYAVLLSLAPNSPGEEKKPMRRPSDQIIAASADTSKVWSRQSERTASIYFFCSESGVLQVDMLNLKPMDSSAGSDGEAALDHIQEAQLLAKLKSQLEQSVFYGGQDNPITTQPSVSVTSVLQNACILISNEILNSESRLFPAILDMHLQLLEKVNKLNRIATVLDDFNLLQTISAETRFRLLDNVEIVVAALAVWQYFNPLLSVVDGRQLQHQHHRAVAIESGHADIVPLRVSVLLNAVRSVLQESATTASGAVEHSIADSASLVRSFFQHHLRLFPSLLLAVQRQVQNMDGLPGETSRARLTMTSPQSIVLFEANRVVLAAWKAAYQYRDQHGPAYGTEQNTDTCARDRDTAAIRLPWTASDELVTSTQRQCDATLAHWGQLLGVRSGRGAAAGEELLDSRFGVGDEEEQSLSDQAVALANFLFRSFEERLRFLERSASSSNDKAERKLREQYAEYQPRAIRQLVQLGRGKDAFILAERYQNYDVLVDLCYDEQLFPAEEAGQKILGYINEYGDPFCWSLFEWYIRNGHKATLLNQSPLVSDTLDKFLHGESSAAMSSSVGYPELSWIHDITLKKYDSAASTLLSLSQQEPSIFKRKTMASIGKLAALCASNQSAFAVSDNYLDLIDSQLLWGAPSNDPAHLPNRGALLNRYFQSLQEEVARGETLTSERLVDLRTLTTRRHPNHNQNQFVVALEVLLKATAAATAHVPPDFDLAREFLLKTIWRRAMLDDDWDGLQALQSDGAIADWLSHSSLHFTVTYCRQSTWFPEDLLLKRPEDALLPSPSDDSEEEEARWMALLQARCGEFRAEEVRQLWQELRGESDRLRSLLLVDSTGGTGTQATSLLRQTFANAMTLQQ